MSITCIALLPPQSSKNPHPFCYAWLCRVASRTDGCPLCQRGRSCGGGRVPRCVLSWARVAGVHGPQSFVGQTGRLLTPREGAHGVQRAYGLRVSPAENML